MKYSRRRAGSRRLGSHNGFVGAIVRGFAFLILVVACVAGIRWISGDFHRNADLWISPGILPVSSGGHNLAVLAGPRLNDIQPRDRRIVYPYSVVPGGVSSPEELREAASHDATVAAHYSGFNYSRARVVEVSEPRLVYLSYRRGDKVYWTRKQASLHKGEKLITDGKTTARTRCGNQVSVLPQSNTSPEEPLMSELDRPDAVASGTQALPGNFDSNLLQVDPVMPIGPSTPGGGPVAGGPPGGFIPLPIGGGPGTPPIKSGCVPSAKNNNCQTPPPPPPPPPPPTVPEPGTMLLVASGAAALVARLRQTKN